MKCDKCKKELRRSREVITAYEFKTRKLIAWLQAFIQHHRHPRCFNAPDLQDAEDMWCEANDFNVRIFNEFINVEDES
jgi:hypothetical protein